MSEYPNITELESLLFRVDSMMGAAEAHGALCGMLCGRGSVELSEWVDHVIGEQQQGNPALHDVVHMLSELHQATLEKMNDAGVEFKLLMPDDDDSLPERVEGLAAWCQGYIYGLAAGGIKQGSELPDEPKEFINDMVEIARVGHEVDDGDDEESNRQEDEEAFMELEEYVRIGTLSVFEELQPLQTTQTVH
jgi:yecA family protein